MRRKRLVVAGTVLLGALAITGGVLWTTLLDGSGKVGNTSSEKQAVLLCEDALRRHAVAQDNLSYLAKTASWRYYYTAQVEHARSDIGTYCGADHPSIKPPPSASGITPAQERLQRLRQTPTP